jgi:hypothetical protein
MMAGFPGGSLKIPQEILPTPRRSADPLIQNFSQRVSATQWTEACPPALWDRYMTESDNHHGRTSTRRIAALSTPTCNVKA